MTSKPKPYRLSRRAVNDLEDIYAYSAHQWSIARAERYVRDLRTAIEQLASGRKIGVRAVAARPIMKLVVTSHVVYFQTDEDGLLVLRILHAAMDAPSRL